MTKISYNLSSKLFPESCKPSIDFKVPEVHPKVSYIRKILTVKLLSRWGGKFLVLPTLPSSQDSLSPADLYAYFNLRRLSPIWLTICSRTFSEHIVSIFRCLLEPGFSMMMLLCNVSEVKSDHCHLSLDWRDKRLLCMI